MSRTYHHGDRMKRRLFGEQFYRGAWPAEPTSPKKPRRHIGPWHWMRGTPSAWNNTMHTRPWRRRVNAAIHRALRRPWEDVVMPHAKRPHIYYW